jgi:alanyl-tRNA synthetase
MKTQEVRRRFIRYFKENAHTHVRSSSVIPHEDPTLLFINAGMNQFKDVFLGESIRDYSRACSSQKCIRVGGKHNDLENVGHTQRHLTFFEMLGNFSFGDYFKKEAIKFAWELSTEVFSFDPDRIWATVFQDDDEAYELWRPYLPEKRIVRFDEKDNFWAMGDIGPCGPCSELYYDRGPNYGENKSLQEDPENERYLEFWNLVFMQYNRDTSGTLTPLPSPSIDTGSGIERVVSLIQGKDNVFETDVLRHLIKEVESISKKQYDPQRETASAFRVIADHLRCLAFAISDGVQPSNLDRGYVLRKVLRRAVRYGRQLDLNEPFLAKLLPSLLDLMGEDYPELKINENRIGEILTIEEENFLRTLQKGGNRLQIVIDQALDSKKEISGEDAFLLKDTYGFPLEEIELIAKDTHLKIDVERFKELEKEAKDRSRKAHKTVEQVASESAYSEIIQEFGACQFTGYTSSQGEGTIIAILKDGEKVSSIKEGEEASIILSHTPFYAEKGGQVGDTGSIHHSDFEFRVTNCQSPFPGIHTHYGILEKGTIQTGQLIRASIDGQRRQNIANNHTATHLLHWALHVVLGEHVKQAGSLVDDTHTRFDFSHHKALTTQQLYEIEDLVNEKIRQNNTVESYELSYDEAQKDAEIKQFFGDKYGNIVRVVDIEFSKELCGGTHTSQTGNIGYFRIEKESSIAAGVRRIEAVTGKSAEALPRRSESVLDDLAQTLKTPKNKLSERIEKLLEENKALLKAQKENQKEQEKIALAALLSKQSKINDVNVLMEKVDGLDIRSMAETLLEKIKSGIVLLVSVKDETACQLLVRISDDLVSAGHKASDYIKVLAPIVSGGGGGKASMAQAGGKDPSKIDTMFETFITLLQNK